MQPNWAAQEMQGAQVWDPRCRRSLANICTALAQQPELSFSRACGATRKAAHRILRRKEVSAAGLLQGHVQATVQRCEGMPLVLAASDTTSLDFSGHTATKNLGPISSLPHQQGFLTHSVLALTPEGVPLGLLSQRSWTRDPNAWGQSEQRKERPTEDKESRKWLDALQDVEAALPQDQPVLLIQDREADVFDFLAAPRRANTHLLLRAAQPRRVQVVGADGPPQTLFEAAAQAPVVAEVVLEVGRRPDRPARQAWLTIRLTQVWVLPPVARAKEKLAPIPVWLVRASEETPSAEGEPLEWVLLCTWPVPGGPEAVQIVAYYAKRWQIERFHYTLKSGCRVEHLQIDEGLALQKVLSLYSVVAWWLLYLTFLARHEPDHPAEDLLEASALVVLEHARRQPVQTAADIVDAVSRLGGFRPVPSAPTPGVKSLWIGLRRLYDMVAGWQLAVRALSPPTGQD